MTLMGTIGKSGRGQDLLSAAARTAANIAGGALAASARAMFASSFPAQKHAGTFGVVIVCFALQYWASDQKGWKGILREMGAGMGGFVGQDGALILRMFFGWGKWDGKKSYKKGDSVVFNNEYYRAVQDIPLGNVVTEPPKDDRWQRVVVAQGLEPAEWYDFAQGLMGNDQLLDGIVREQITIFGPELAQCLGREISQSEANQIYDGMRNSLRSVVQKYGA